MFTSVLHVLVITIVVLCSALFGQSAASDGIAAQVASIV